MTHFWCNLNCGQEEQQGMALAILGFRRRDLNASLQQRSLLAIHKPLAQVV